MLHSSEGEYEWLVSLVSEALILLKASMAEGVLTAGPAHAFLKLLKSASSSSREPTARPLIDAIQCSGI